MKLRNRNGFITVYAMLSMMFFVVFAVTASVTASRKLKLQKEANSALIDIYSQNIENMNQTGETTIPIYTQAQFEQIANWIYPHVDGSDATSMGNDEYIYVNDVVYLLDSSEVDRYQFVLKTDLWFKGKVNGGVDKDEYPHIPVENEYHTVIQYLQLDNYKIHLIHEEKEVFYGIIIQINDAVDFSKIGTRARIGDIEATPSAKYEITSDIDLTGKIINSQIDFTGTIVGTDGNGKRKERIIKGLKIDTNNGGWFNENSGTIDNLIFTDVEIDTTNHIDENQNLGIIAKSNSGTISNCTIQISNQTNDEYCTINGNGKKFNNFGIIVGSNSGTIENCNIQAVKITRNRSSKFRFDCRN